MELKEQTKYFEVRLYPNSTFKTVESKPDFHECHLTNIFNSFNGDTKESYCYLVAEEKNIEKAKQRIAKNLLREAKKNLDAAQKKFDFLTKILG
jgi:selenophosphate synthase